MNEGEYTCLKIFKYAADTVPAYKALLKSLDIPVDAVVAQGDISRIPVIDKKSYVHAHDVSLLTPEGSLPPMIYSSSGSSGVPTFWFLHDHNEEDGGVIHAEIFKNMFKIRPEDSTLVIVCFSMGIWIAGTFTMAACRHVARMGYNCSVITPGIQKNDIVHIFKTIAPRYQNVVIAGYPPFLMDVFRDLRDQHIDLPSSLKIITAGDKISEHWRDEAMNLIPFGTTTDIVNLYGCADAGVLAYETALSIGIRRTARSQPALWRSLFGDADQEPLLVQYDPSRIHFEEVDGELVFTTRSGIPLVRYNIHDLGQIIPYDDMLEILRHSGVLSDLHVSVDQSPSWPFIVKNGRSDVAVTFYALNIYPENIAAGLNDISVKDEVSGSYFVYTVDSTMSEAEGLHLNVELRENAIASDELVHRVQSAVTFHLLEKNMEFRKLHETIGTRAVPKIHLVSFGDANLQKPSQRGVAQLGGKKPKVIL